MWSNLIKLSWRSQIREKFTNLTHLGGLSVGLCIDTLIGLWIYDELSYNHSYINYDRLGIITVREIKDGKIESEFKKGMKKG